MLRPHSPRDPDLWALLLVALALVMCGGGSLAFIAWWVWQAVK